MVNHKERLQEIPSVAFRHFSSFFLFIFGESLTMKIRSWFITFCVVLTFGGLSFPAMAADFGDSKDVKQVRKVVAAKFGKVLHVSVSHDWALCTAYQDESDLSVVLHRTAAGWTIAEHDGGAFDAVTLKKLGVPPADTAPLLKAYQ
jgi:hypothetical protein